MKQTNTPTVLTLALVLIFTAPAQALADDALDEEANSGTTRTLVKTGGGCLGGALLGSVIPIFGTAAGCVLGGLAGWWFSDDTDEDDDLADTAFVADTPASGE